LPISPFQASGDDSFRLLRGLGHDGIVHPGIELRTNGIDLVHADPPQQIDEQVLRQTDSPENFAFIVMFRGVERTLQVIEHGKKLAQKVGLSSGAGLDQLPARPSTEIVELCPLAKKLV
jgi:hypothetical protein